MPKTNEERIVEIRSSKWIGYSTADTILEKLEDLMDHPQVHRMPALLIYGGTNNGKTTIVNELLRRHPVKRDKHDESTQLPIVMVEMPPEANQDSIYMTILRSLYVPFQPNAKKEEKANQVFGVMRRLKVKMLIIDELHNLLDTNRLRQNQVINTIKYLSNTLKIPIVAVGTLEAKNVFSSDDQLANRFKPVEIPKWKIDLEYRKLLASFEKLMALKKPSNLDSKELAIEIMSMSEGWIGEISDILKLASIEAIKSGTERITLDLLRNLDWQSPTERRA